MNLHNAEAVGGKRFEALIKTAQYVEAQLEDRSFRYDSFAVDADAYEITAKLSAANSREFRALVEVVGSPEVSADRLLTSHEIPTVAVSIDPTQIGRGKIAAWQQKNDESTKGNQPEDRCGCR